MARLLERTGQAWMGTQGPNRTFDALPMLLDGLALFLDSLLERPVVNKTRIPGMFDLHLEFSPEGTALAADPAVAVLDPPAAPSIFTALQEQLGLRLEPAKGPGEFLVIDHVEKPSEN